MPIGSIGYDLRMPAKLMSRRRIGRAIFLLVLASCAVLGFGLMPGDEAAFRTFDEAVLRWQRNPEFRSVAMEYCVLGSRAMRTHPLGIATRRAIMGLRSLPLLPKKYAVNPTSRSHYEDFTRGPLSAYLHLSSEQDISQYVGMFESVGARTNARAADLHALLDSFHMDFPVAKDTGAVQSVAVLLADADAARPFSIRQNVGPRLLPAIASVARELGFPTATDEMDAAQQQAVFERLDDYVRRHDPELWRAKQLNDFCGGVWAQVYGPPYRSVIAPFVAIDDACRLGVVALLLLGVMMLLRASRRRTVASQAQAAQDPAAPKVAHSEPGKKRGTGF